MEINELLPENNQIVLSTNADATLSKIEQTGLYIESQE